MPNKPISPTHRRVNLRSDTDETSRDGELEVVVFGEEGDDFGDDGSTVEFAVFAFGDETWADLDALL